MWLKFYGNTLTIFVDALCLREKQQLKISAK